MADIKDEHGIIHTTSRSLRPVNYAEESEGVEQENIRQNRRQRRIHREESEDESFHEDDDAPTEDDDGEVSSKDSEDDAPMHHSQRRTRNRNNMRNFVVPDPDDEEEDDDDEDALSRRRLRRSTRLHKLSEGESHGTRWKRSANHLDDDTNSLEEEIKELQDDGSSPIRSKRFLRERTKPVNYTLPPLINQPTGSAAFQPSANNATDDFATGELGTNLSANMHASPRRNYNTTGSGTTGNKYGPIRRLFPTGGPFGGNDTLTIFGKNTNFYSSQNTNKLILDSDSSDDEIVPLGIKPTNKKELSNSSKKKKQEIADLDPLGVDKSINFEEIGGLDNYIDQLKEMVLLPLLYPEIYGSFDITPPKGVLFHGPPGTGKTLMARALAASCSDKDRKITFFMRKGADILSKWVGEAERQLRLLFDEAKKHQPSIIFFDEIDGLAPVRSSKQEQIHASIVSTLLALMDGMENRGQVIVIGATNRPDAIDPALRRPGRFDREFYFPLPDIEARSKILKIHTKKWQNPPSVAFINKLANMTKGYGGADLRSLCTEAALLCVQRKFPQIYRSEKKLQIDTTRLRVKTVDFMLALEKIVPSSARTTGNLSRPLPDHVSPLLADQLEKIVVAVRDILPPKFLSLKKDVSMIQYHIDYEDFDQDTDDEDDNNFLFGKLAMVNKISESRVYKPRVLITGQSGNGQQYIGSAILSNLEEYNVQKLDIASLLSDTTRSLESTVVEGFIEARKRQPSVLFIPNMEVWINTVPDTVISTLVSMLKSLPSNERVLLLGTTEDVDNKNLYETKMRHLFNNEDMLEIALPCYEQRLEFFSSLKTCLELSPKMFETNKKRRVPLPELPLVDLRRATERDADGKVLSPEEKLRKKLKSFQHQDMKVKNLLKIKLSGLMDLFKNRYKRFRKPPIDDSFLVHLFEPQPSDPNWVPAYTKEDDMILEVTTGKKFFNMDLDIIEERLWNGFYSEPKQFLKDIELIYRDALTIGDRERVIKASEMFANAQMGIEDISTAEFIMECKATRERDLERQQLFLKEEEEKNRIAIADLKASDQQNVDTSTARSLGVAAGNQLQAQSEVNDPSMSKDTDVNHNVFITGDTDLSNYANGEIKKVPKGDAVNVDKLEPEEKHPLKDFTPILQNENVDSKTPIDNENSNGYDPALESIIINEKTCQSSNQKPNDDEPHVIVDQELLNSTIERIARKTQNCTVSKLEEIHTSLLRITWNDRLQLDKGKTLRKLADFIDSR